MTGAVGAALATAMTNAKLYNCRTGHRAPEWDLFDGFEVAGCAVDPDDGHTYQTDNGETPTFWCVFGHLKAGGLDAITDCKTRAEADNIAERFEYMISEHHANITPAKHYRRP